MNTIESQEATYAAEQTLEVGTVWQGWTVYQESPHGGFWAKQKDVQETLHLVMVDGQIVVQCVCPF